MTSRFRNKQSICLNLNNSKMNTIFFISLALLTIRINCYLNSPTTIFLPRHTSSIQARQLSVLAYQDERYATSSSSSSTVSNNRRSRTNGNNSSLERRLRDIYKNDQKKSSVKRHSVVKVVHTLDEFKNVLSNEGKNKIVIVRFYANWCKACKATKQYYYSLANRFNELKHNNICFVDVPITDKNVDLHQGLGIPSIPYGHIYIPDNNNNKDGQDHDHHEGGLIVEEFRMMKKVYKNHKVSTLLNWYTQGYCNLKIEDNTDGNDDDVDVNDEDYCLGPYCMIDDIDDDEHFTELK